MKKVLLIVLLLFSFSYLCSFAQERNYTAIMRQAMQEQDYERAKNIYELAKQDDYFDIAEVENILCVMHYANKEYKQAYSVAKKLSNEDESGFLSDIVMYSFLSKNRKNDSIIGESIEDFDVKNIPMSALLDLQIIEKKDLDNICNAIERYIDKFNISKMERIPYRTLQTLLYFIQNNYMQAYNKALDILSEDNIALIDFVLGRIREERQEYVSALAFYNSAIRKGYVNRDIYLHKALCNGYNSDYVLSNIDLDTCLFIKDDYYIYYLKGINYNHLRDYTNAIQCFNTAILLCDTFADAYNYRGIVHANCKQYEFALMDFRTCFRLNENTPYIHDNLGLALEYTGNVIEAVKEYNLSIKKEPKYFDAYYNLGRLYSEDLQPAKALRYLKKALALETEVPDIYYLIGINLARTNKIKSACEYLTISLEMGHTKAMEAIEEVCVKDK